MKTFLQACKAPAIGAVRGIAGGVLVPALLWGVPVLGTLALADAIVEGSRYPETVVVLAFAAALSTAYAYLLTGWERQSDEASLWAASALWLSLFAAAAFDLSDAARGPREGDLVWLVGIAVFCAVWVPYAWVRWRALPHATAWTLAAASALPYVLANLLAFPPELASAQHLLLYGAVASAVAGVAASVFAVRCLPASARMVVLATAVCLLGPVWLEVAASPSSGASPSSDALGPLMAGALLALLLLAVEHFGWRAVLCERGVVLIPAVAAVGTGFALSPDAFVLAAFVGGAIAIGAWWRFVAKRAGRSAAAQGAALRAAGAWLRSGAIAGAMLGTASLWGFLVSGFAWDRSSAQTLVWLREAGVPDIDEGDVTGALVRDVYLWRDQGVTSKQRAPLELPLGFWKLPEFDRWSAAASRASVGPGVAEEPVGTGLLVTRDGRTTTVVVAPEGSPAHAVGIRRGDRISSWEEDAFAEDVSPGPVGLFAVNFPMTITVASPDGHHRTVELPEPEPRQRRVIRTAKMDAGGRRVGYIAMLRFDAVAEREFAGAIASLRAEGVRTLVVDLRYNPGGRVLATAGIAGAIVGERGRGRVFASTHHNSRYRDRDYVYPLRIPPGGGLGAEQLVVITSGATCSASELLVKGLEPYLPVATVGARTCGKPVGSTRLDSAFWSYSVISFEARNALGEGGYFDGLPPTCVTTDDVAHELGDPEEASLREALHYIATGRCSAGSAGLAVAADAAHGT